MTHPTVDISNLTVQQLVALRGDIDAQMAARQQAELDKLRADIMELCASHGYTLQQVINPPKKKAPKKTDGGSAHFIKGKTYQNPANPSQTWYGFGQRPTWVRDHLASGAPLSLLEAPAETPVAPEAPAVAAATPAPAPAQKPVSKKRPSKKVTKSAPKTAKPSVQPAAE